MNKNKELLESAIRYAALPTADGVIAGFTRDEVALLFEDCEALFNFEMTKLRFRETLFDGGSDRIDYGDNL